MGVVAIEDSEAGHAVGCGHCGNIILVPQSRTAAGAIIDDFVIEKEIGQGGLATVYLAHQMSLDRPAAVKILRPQYAANKTFLADFLKEARAAAQLNHPNIVQAFAVGEDDGINFFAMEYVQGTTLKHVLAHSGRLVADRALEIIQVIAQALAFAWEKKKLVHLDIKPDNIILTEAGEVKLADLGLARVGTELKRDSEETSDVFGTPQYISPELLTGCPTDNRTDIYSLGATLYHAVTGKYPYNGASAGEIARRHITERLVPAGKAAPDIAKDVSDLIDLMMAKRPNHRYQSADEVVKEIAAIRKGKPLARHPLPCFQEPINLENLEEEFASTLADAESGKSATAGGAGKKRLSMKKPGIRLAGKPGPPAGFTFGARAAASPAAPAPGEVVAAGQPPTPPAADGSQAEAAAPPPYVLPKPRKHLSPGALVGILATVVLVIVALGMVAILVFKNVGETKREQERIARMGLTLPEYQELLEFRRIVATAGDDQAVLTAARELLDRHRGNAAIEHYVTTDVAPAREREIRDWRRKLRQQELLAWRRESRRLQDAARQADIDAEIERKRAEEERLRLERQQREQRLQAEQAARLRGQLPELRRQSVALCREMRFAQAKLLFAEMANAADAALAETGKAMSSAIEMADRLFTAISEGGEFLKGEQITVKGRRPTITAIGVTGISAEHREPVYDRGKIVSERVETVTIPLAELRADRLVKLAEALWTKRGLDMDELNLLLGAYLFCRAEEMNLAIRYLGNTGRDDQAGPILREIEAMRGGN